MKQKVRQILFPGKSLVVIILLWFSMGFLFPLLFEDLSQSGNFGDGFGAINALFSGIGTWAIAYTIYIQIQGRKKEKKNRQFELHLKLVDDIKEDLDRVDIVGSRGINGMNELKKFVKGYWQRIESGEFNHSFNYLLSILAQFEYLLEQIKKYKDTSKRKEFLMHKVSAVYLAYFMGLLGAVETYARANDNNNPFQRLYKIANHLLEAVLMKVPSKHVAIKNKDNH
jgi:purine-cytosine permease-like protein